MGKATALAHAPELFKLLSNDIRWNILMLLARSDSSGLELVRSLKQPQNLISYHIRLLVEQQLVSERRSSADERLAYYSLNLETLRFLYTTSGESLHPVLHVPELLEGERGPMGSYLAMQAVRVLFLCTHNSARSQIAEGALRALSGGRIEVASGGSHPTQLHPLAVQAMHTLGMDIGHQHSKHLREFTGQTFDYVITVCDRVRESCPAFPGDPERIHWSFPDPAEAEGDEEERSQIFELTARQLMTRIRYFLLLIEREHARPHQHVV
ncbi:ArsR family transcriptional regulator [Ktedonobacter sp. SOSP1-52]|uniref:arsenate reductase/protein-tyrosine-phosphatase family protein n=1 Tax=Ktedonobacter sp. SOSP1-52 TaxID=2778366 RepID=UPI0019150A88|nr:ArsR family transcriptional regulator [Ktedonobacter sp. SOSP1-52]GHO63621.1 ArsR family transcriptional regulator [Ktedonobacter sp. SOSP1-52]